MGNTFVVAPDGVGTLILRTICDDIPVAEFVALIAPRDVIVSGTTVPETGMFWLPIICCGGVEEGKLG